MAASIAEAELASSWVAPLIARTCDIELRIDGKVANWVIFICHFIYKYIYPYEVNLRGLIPALLLQLCKPVSNKYR